MLNPTDPPGKTITAFGINHHTADAALREKFAFTPEETLTALANCCEATGASEIALLSTCNRSEIYAVGGDRARLVQWLAAHKTTAPDALENLTFHYRDRDAIRHIYRVAQTLIGAERVQLNPPPSMAAEDFAIMLQERPGAYIWLGNGKPHPAAVLHSPNYDFNDDILATGASLWIALAQAQT